MNMRRLSYGLLVSFSAAMLVACGDDAPAGTPPQPSASAEAPPAPVASATPEAAPAPPPPAPAPEPAPPVKTAKDKFTGKFTQAFAGEIKEAAEKASAKMKDAAKTKAMEKAEKAVKDLDSSVEVSGDQVVFSSKGKVLHTYSFTVVKADDPNNVTVKFTKDGKKEIKGGLEVQVTFLDDNTISFKDPSSKAGKVLVFKK